MRKSKPAHKSAALKRQKKSIKQQIKRKRPAHRRILLHPITVFALLCALVIMIDWTYQAVADTTISAKILAPPLTQGAIITYPTAGATYTSETMTVAGTCPTDSYVSLTQNGSFSGVAVCVSDHTFHIQVTLLEGGNSFVATAYNITDEPGPATPAVSVQLQLPSKPSVATSTKAATATPTPTSTPVSDATPAVSTAPPLVLNSAFQWQTFQTNSKFSWKMDVEGGQPPYAVTVDWGDGQTTKYNFAVDPVFEISHEYKAAGYFVIKANSVDATGGQRVMQLAALISTPGKAASFLSNSSGTGAATSNTAAVSKPRFFVATKNWLWVAWPSLAVILLMTFSFWLGEAEDRRLILVHQRISRR